MIKNYIFCVFALFVLSNCGEEEIDLNLDTHVPGLVVEGLITTDTMAHRVRLSKSGDYFHNQPLPDVSGAYVTIFDGHREVVLEESPDYPGHYFTPSDYYGIPERKYTLEVSGIDISGDGREELFSAQSYMNPVIPADSIIVDYLRVWRMWQIKLFAQDPPDEENYYLFRLLINGERVLNSFSELTYTDDYMFDGNNVGGVWIYGIDAEDESIDLKPGDVITLEGYMIDEDYYHFLIAAGIETSPKIPLFSSSPGNVPGNISNGAYGIFTACAVSRTSVINWHTEEEMRNRK